MVKDTVENIIINAASLKKDEKVLILYDSTTSEVAECFYSYTKNYSSNVDKTEIENSSCHGCEPPSNVAIKMLNSDVIICLTQKSLAHTQARKKANLKGVRFLSLPDYNLNLLKNDALKVNFKEYLKDVNLFTEFLTKGKSIKVQTENGTDILFDITNRKGNCCPGFVDAAHLLGSPPDIEANIAPIETLTNGTICVDGSITCQELGLLSDNVVLEIKNGKISKILSDKKYYTDQLNKILDTDSKKILAEIGIGFNHDAKLCGNMLVDEGCYGCVHFGFGSNSTIGGENNVNFHLDFVIMNPDLYIDNIKFIDKGVINI